MQARRLVFDRVGSFSVNRCSLNIFLLIGLFIYVFCDTRNTIRRCIVSYLKSCGPGKSAVLGTSGSMLSWAGAADQVLEEG